MNIDKEEPKAVALTLEQLDGFVVDLIEALKTIDDTFAVAEVSGVLLTTELKELLLFVGITSKQTKESIIFTWTETLEKLNHKEY